MTSLDEPAAAVPIETRAAPTSRFARFEALLARLSDRLNPILVKEARQALRSRQFTTTFLLMLAAGWTWSVLGLALLGPGAYYNAEGPRMFYVYYVILAAPLLVVIPHAAFTSLASERQDRTYELVSITALSARQILAGKLCGVALQMIVYLSALFPCLAFTYLLRGLSIFSVFLVVVYTCLLSLGLAMLGLLIAALTPLRQRQIIPSVALAVLLVYVFGLDVMTMSAIISGEFLRVDDAEFWELNLVLATFYANAFAIAFLAARSQLTTACQNRSTALRVSLVVALVSMIAWSAWAVLRWDEEAVYALVFGGTAFWFLAGMFMVGEPRALSPRVRRGLPQSLLGRVFLSAFAPGPGTGYLLAIAGMIAISAASALIATPSFRALGEASAGRLAAGSIDQFYEIVGTSVIATSYVAIYLGIGKLILGVVTRYSEVRLAVRFLVHVLLLLAGGGIPWVVQISIPSMRDLGYTLLQTSNPVWTLTELCFAAGLSPATAPLLVVLPLAAFVVYALNLPGLASELSLPRAAKPPRVVEEDARLAAPAAAPARTSPWDE
jgi:hypothetical protein